jgi:hypothetical protein
MFTEDYLMRIINQALAALLTAIGLKKRGKYKEARQAVEQAVEWLTGLQAGVVDQMDDDSILSLLTVEERLDVARLAVLADLYWEQGENLLELGEAAPGEAACARALRFTLEAALAGEGDLSPGNVGKIESRRKALREDDLPVETRVALLDFFQRLLEKDDQTLAAAGVDRKPIAAAHKKLQAQLGPYLKPTNE